MFRDLFKPKSVGQAEAHYKRGNALRDQGRFADALAAYDETVSLKPDFSRAWCNRGAVQQGLGLSEQALDSYDRAIALDPSDAIVHTNRGSLLIGLSRWEPALHSYERALALDPALHQVWFQRGNILNVLGRPDEAMSSYSEAVRLKPDHAEALYNCGVLMERAERPQAALASYDKALATHPGFAEAHYNRAGVLKSLGDRAAALAAYDSAIACRADYAEAYANRGVVLQQLGRMAAALESYERAISIRPDQAEAYFNRGTLLSEQMRWDAALASHADAIARRPGYAAAYCERARILMQLGRLGEALAAYDQAVDSEPDFAEAQYNRSMALLMSGDYENGWAGYEWRWKNADRLALTEPRVFSQPLWLGKESIADRRILVYAEQGYGDTLQFCRYVMLLRDLGATVIVEVQEPLVGLLTALDGASSVIARGSPLPQFDIQCPFMSLPLALKTSIRSIPAPVRYVNSAESKVAHWRERLKDLGRPLVGLAWSGNPAQGNDRERSTRLADWIPHLPRDCHYVCLQREIRPADQETLDANPWILRFDPDFSDTAALCDCMDLIISVCTSIAHLGGALGRPTWVLLSFVADWRWLVDRDDSPWYPAAKLYRQSAPGDWSGVLSRVNADLSRLASSS